MLLTSAEREQLAQIGTRIRLPARMVIYKEESPADWVFAITDGCVKCYRELPSGKRALSAFLFARDLFGLAENGRYTNTVQAVTNVTLYRLPIMELANAPQAGRQPAVQVPVEGDARTALLAAARDSHQPARCGRAVRDVHHHDGESGSGGERRTGSAAADGALRHRRLPRPVARIGEPLRFGARTQRPREVREPPPRADPRRRTHVETRRGRL